MIGSAGSEDSTEQLRDDFLGCFPALTRHFLCALKQIVVDLECCCIIKFKIWNSEWRRDRDSNPG